MAKIFGMFDFDEPAPEPPKVTLGEVQRTMTDMLRIFYEGKAGKMFHEQAKLIEEITRIGTPIKVRKPK